MGEVITYRPMAEADLPLMTDWLNREHLRAFYQREPITEAKVAAKYGPRIRGEAPTHSSLALLGGAPFGYLQCYRIADWPEWQEAIGVEHGISIDLFIGEADLIGRGTGRQMLAGYVEQVAFPTYPSERLCWIAHELENLPARRCSAAAGFTPVREFVEDARPSILMVRQTRALT
ncbi:MAG TPA: GNAT family N-acetyltransferase [Caulobacteraceae bacterium]|jgi:aminoglycoside 6'-N-acetyltransferase